LKYVDSSNKWQRDIGLSTALAETNSNSKMLITNIRQGIDPRM